LYTSFLFADAHRQRSRSASVARSKGISKVADAHRQINLASGKFEMEL
jgi:hypothetical protein